MIRVFLLNYFAGGVGVGGVGVLGVSFVYFILLLWLIFLMIRPTQVTTTRVVPKQRQNNYNYL